MVVIKVTKTKVGNVQKKIANLQTFLKNDLAREVYTKAEQKIQNKWKTDIPRIFNVRSSMGMACDGILAKSLDIVQRGKNDIIIYVEPIVRFGKSTKSSGGAVNNLTSILFRGSKSSYGAYSPRWDARTQSGIHPGTSASTMRNYWRIFKEYAKKEIRKGINDAMKVRMKK